MEASASSGFSLEKLQGRDGDELLNVVDKLRGLSNIRQELSLPQIVVVGQQSSGKSSVLEALINAPFAVNEGLGTRFATEIILRRRKEEKCTVSIIPFHPSPEKQKDAVDFQTKWAEVFSSTAIEQTLTELSNVIEDAKTVMQLSTYSYTEDILRIELWGPDLDHLTLIDLPGIIEVATSKHKPEDVFLVKKIAKSYMTKDKTITMAVISGESDYETQPIFQFLRSVHPDRRRILGVITGPDKITPLSTREQLFMNLARNEEKFRLALDWHVLRNLSQKERQDGCDRGEIEQEFFRTSSWSAMLPHKRGILALRHRLASLLKEHITKELPDIDSKVQTTIEQCETELRGLGDERSSKEQQQIYLIHIGEQLKGLIEKALVGEYHDAYFENPKRRLRAEIANGNTKFAEAMRTRGHRWEVQEVTDHGESSTVSSSNAFLTEPTSSGEVSPIPISRKGLIKHVLELQKTHRGLELPGTFQPALVGMLFREQASSWKSIVDRHVEDTYDFVKSFIESALHHVAHKETARLLLLHLIDPILEDRRKNLLAKVEEIIRPYTKGHPITLNTNYVSALLKAPQSQQTGSEANISTSEDLEMDACTQVVNVMQSYYQVALGVLVDNVAILAIEQCLLEELDGLIPPSIAIRASEEKLALLASETEATATRRQYLKGKLVDFQRAHDILRPHVIRPTTPLGFPSSWQSSRERYSLSVSETKSQMTDVPNPIFSFSAPMLEKGITTETRIRQTASNGPTVIQPQDKSGGSSNFKAGEILKTTEDWLDAAPRKSPRLSVSITPHTKTESVESGDPKTIESSSVNTDITNPFSPHRPVTSASPRLDSGPSNLIDRRSASPLSHQKKLSEGNQAPKSENAANLPSSSRSPSFNFGNFNSGGLRSNIAPSSASADEGGGGSHEGGGSPSSRKEK